MCPKKENKSLVPVTSNVCHSSNIGKLSNFLLPVITLQMSGSNGQKIKFNVLFDTGSTRSYINTQLAKCLGIDVNKMPMTETFVRTFLGTGTKRMGEKGITVHFPSGRRLVLPIFIDEEFSLKLEVRGLGLLVKNLRNDRVPLGADYPVNSDELAVAGLIGNDIIQFIQFRSVPCLNGQALCINDKLSPFGNTAHFLYSRQVSGNIQNSHVENNFHTIMQNVHCSPKLVDKCMEPKASYEDGLAPLFEASMVEHRIDRMLNCDNVGIEEVPDISTYDQEKLEQFKSGIEVRDYVYVELIWKENVKDVPSNHPVALKVLERVCNKLEANGLLERYNEVFFDQLEKNIIEEFSCSPSEFSKYVWLPHRPVIKQDEQCSTKIRPVFNASLKTCKDKPSLNEASYAGVNIMQNMLSLLLLFRTNSKVLLGDLEKAFLQIRLKRMSDRNKFCFFLKDKDKIRCFRYNTILFGFVCSPFILNYVIQHIAGLYPDDECTRVIQSKFFVDNLVYTCNSSESLAGIYRECASRLDRSHFNLQACNSNCETLRQEMIQDGRYITHGCEWDKVLGYQYHAVADTFKLSKCSLDIHATTKREVLAESSKLFDPISLTAPVTIRARILLAKLWDQKDSPDHWDKSILEEDQRTWSKMSIDFNKLSDLEFPRMTCSLDVDMDLFVFCDASKAAYGFATYSLQRGESQLVFAKAKVAPLRVKRTLPQLELLGALAGLQGLETLVGIYKNVSKVFLAVDAQIVLSWLTSPIVTKNIYTANRLKDIRKICENLKSKYDVEVCFRYVPTQMNPADLITRGVSFEEFQDKFEFWNHGPDWIRTNGNVSWPAAELKCLSEASKNVVCTATLGEVAESRTPLVKCEKFSKWTKLVSTWAFVLKFLSIKKVLSHETRMRLWGTSDFIECAKLLLVKQMQEESFSKELEFLKGKGDTAVPERVRDLNLFLDQRGLIRCEGRMAKVEAFDQDLINPIVLGKNHHITNLIIMNAHQKVKHLGIQPTLNKLRMDGFRLIRPLNTVRVALKNCFICKKMNTLSFQYPRMTNLPAHRVNLVRVYSHIGVDYTGSIMVREGEVDHKFYLLIFTCLQVRACHIELLPDMTAEQFVLALVRFSNLYGIPEYLYSDNAPSISAGTNKVATKSKVSKILESEGFKEKFGDDVIKHQCIPLGAPWVGSCWERIIGTIKGCLRKTVGRQKLEYFKLLTVLSDIQHAINCRPLTYRCADNNSLEIISPLSFLNPCGINSLLVRNAALATPPTATNQELNQTLKLRDELLDQFKETWKNEYLLSLRDSYRNLRQVNFADKVAIGDVVLIKNIQPKFIKSRQFWSLGRVMKVHTGSDGHIRSALVLRGVADYRTRKRELEVHPINHLYPLELTVTHDHKTPITDAEIIQVREAEGELVDDLPVNENEELCSNLEDGTKDVDTELTERDVSNLPKLSSRGRMIIPKRGNEDFVSH